MEGYPIRIQTGMLTRSYGSVDKVDGRGNLACVCYGEATMLVHGISDLTEPYTFEFEWIAVWYAWFAGMRTVDHD
jgi:hypothetical protein